ncbi:MULTISPECIES: helix-turn-helix domain-containing protein [Bacillus cereus group]|uniref:Helix-turn-helix domain protein n=1 Tax=Bacillus cereus (strain AH187) TaxID=405534 RepID=B7HU88_BACC7|nr:MULTISPECIES: helix-turn-helix transcriptional regulator [Bacillus cereus group]ACJ81635.1 helix-turn-helix domain protein [Bacillus cereus AH187]ADA84966.1 helix-turn-helix domain protein [Bacillus phage 11143]MBL3754046.1 helix-turn-helix transcriptional regulator [Bacillus cereus]MBR9742281.1 XRE family transcriptional regulator [Bacillus paranthracis]MCC2374446.1 helix-turn-helix domain-containing protein [Bacillus paranthracis]
MAFSKKLKELREGKGLSQEELALKLNIPRSSITHYENSDDRLPRKSRLLEIADFFNVSVDFLLSDSKEEIQLSKKEERDIARDLERTLEQLDNSEDALMFDGEPIDDDTKELIRMSLEKSMRMAKKMAKQKFTPNKYKK